MAGTSDGRNVRPGMRTDSNGDPDALARRIEAIAQELAGGGVWVLGGEPNTDPPEASAARAARILIARLSSYRDVASSTSHGVVADLLRRAGSVFCDFAYLPPARDRAVLRREGIPPWFGTTTRRPPRDFDVLAISASVATEFLNLPYLLDASGIPLAREDRLDDPAAPLVILGGAASGHTSVLHGNARPGRGGLVDAVIVGEAEEAGPALAALLVRAKAEGWDKRRAIAEAVRAVPGLYDPSLYVQRFGGDPARLVAVEPAAPDVPFPVRRAAAIDLDRSPEPVHLPIPYEPDGIGTARIRVAFGCPYACTFCQEGWDHKPYRERSVEALGAAFREAKAALGAGEVDLYSFNFNIHSRIHRLLREAASAFDRVALRSQRIDLLARDPGLWRIERMLGKRIVTIGIEGISPRLRRFLGKGIAEEDLARGLDVLLRDPPGQLKIFLIATGIEEEADFDAFDAFALNLAEKVRRYRGRTRVVLSVTPLFVAPHTPLAFRGAGISIEEYRTVRREIEGIGRRHGIEVRAAADEAEIRVAPILMLGDRRVTAALVRAQVDGDALFDERVPDAAAARLLAELARDGLGPENFLFERDLADPFPWDDIAAGASKTFLFDAWTEAKRGRDASSCFDATGRGSRCLACGACRTPEEIAAITRQRAADPTGAADIERVLESKRSPDRLFVKLDVAASHRRIDARFWPTGAARAILLAAPDLVDPFLGPDPPEPEIVRGAAGERWIALRFRRGSLGRSADACAKLPDAANRELRGARILTVSTAKPDPPRLLEITIEAPGVSPDAMAASIANPPRGRPLPLTLRKRDGGIELAPEGKAAAKCTVISAHIEAAGAGARAIIRCRPAFDIAGLLRSLRPGDADPKTHPIVTVQLDPE